MFNQYTVESRIKKDKKKHGQTIVLPSPPRRKMDPQEINELVRKNVRDAILLGGAVYTLVKLADSGSRVAVIAANAYFYKNYG